MLLDISVDTDLMISMETSADLSKRLGETSVTVVTGATGQLGRQIVEGLSKKVPSAEISVSVRNPELADDLKERGIRVCKGDFADPVSLREAFDGAEQVLIVSVNKLGAEALQQHGNAIQAAKEAGAKRILYTSHQGASSTSAFMPARNHAATEAMLRASGVPYVSLRNGFYAESALFQLSGVKETGKIALPEDGPVSWTARADLAEAAVAALVQTDLFDGISPPLTASKTLDFADVARVASEMLGREITRELVSDETYRAGLLARGLPEMFADAFGSLYKASRAREFAVVDPTLGRLLGRSPVTMREVLSDFLSNPKL